MNCQGLKEAIHPYLDRELDLEHSLEVEQHLKECAGCAQAYNQQSKLHSVVAERLNYFAAPRRLRRNVRTALQHVQPAVLSRSNWWWAWFNNRTAFATVTLALIACLALLLVPSARNNLPHQLVVAQVRSLMPGHLMDVASSDQHTVKPWFNGKLDFSPLVVDLSAEGFPLLGGRLDYLNDRPVAVVVYQRRKHYINLFIWPSAERSSSAGKVLSRQGYHMLHWSDLGMSFWAVSDVNPAELEQFAQELRRFESVPSSRGNP